MKFILDTDSISFLFAKTGKEHDKIKKKLSQRDDDDIIQVSFMTIFELEYSHSNSTDTTKENEIRDAIENTQHLFQIIPLKIEFATIYGELKSELKNHWGNSTKGMRKYSIDLMIASTAIAEGATLISHDRLYRNLIKINSKFQFENWTK